MSDDRGYVVQTRWDVKGRWRSKWRLGAGDTKSEAIWLFDRRDALKMGYRNLRRRGLARVVRCHAEAPEVEGE